MTSLADLPELIGFFSYSRDDDQDSNNALSTIRALIQNELRARLGRSRQSLRLWQDQEALAPGSLWESQINAAVQQSVFFIPIITPRVINSKYCGIEFKRFLDRELELGRDDLVFPILYIDVDELQDENQWRGHPLLEVIGQRQYADWREYRYELDSPTLRRAAANLCAKIAATLRRPQPDERAEAAEKAAAQREADRVAREHAEQERRRDKDAARARIEAEHRDRANAEMPPLNQELDLPDAEKSRSERQQEDQPKGANPRLSEPLRAAIRSTDGLRPGDPSVPQSLNDDGGHKTEKILAEPVAVVPQVGSLNTESETATGGPMHRHSAPPRNVSDHRAKIPEKKTREEKDVTTPAIEATPPAHPVTNIVSPQVVSKALMIQAIFRGGFAIYLLMIAPPHVFYNSAAEHFFKPMSQIWLAWAAVTIAIALAIAWHKTWAHLFGLIVCIVGAVNDAFFASLVILDTHTPIMFFPVLELLSALYFSVDVISVIYLLRARVSGNIKKGVA